jgi:hypothetical protein
LIENLFHELEFLTIAGYDLLIDLFAFVDDAISLIDLLKKLPIDVFGHFEYFLHLSQLHHAASIVLIAFLAVLL